MTTRILVTGAGALLGQGIIRSIQSSTLDAEIIAVDPSPLSAGLYWTNARYLVPMATADNYLSQVQRVIEKERPDIILVGTDVELSIFAEARAHLEASGTQILVSSPAVIAIADDKYKTFKFLKDFGFPYPRSALASEADTFVSNVGFPFITKPRVGARSVGVQIIRNAQDLALAVSRRPDLILQELAGPENQEFTAGVICFHGKCLASIVMRRDLRDGNTYRAFVDGSEELNKAVRTLGEALSPYGPANFQFRTDSNGEPKVFEINARFSGTTPLRALAGFNEVEMCVRYLVLGTEIQQPTIAQKIFLRQWSETVVDPEDVEQLINGS